MRYAIAPIPPAPAIEPTTVPAIAPGERPPKYEKKTNSIISHRYKWYIWIKALRLPKPVYFYIISTLINIPYVSSVSLTSRKWLQSCNLDNCIYLNLKLLISSKHVKTFLLKSEALL